MITTSLIGFALLAVRKVEQQASAAWKPSPKDVDDLAAKLKEFEKKEVNGRMQYPFELYLESRNIISFDEFGRWQVVNTHIYPRENETYAFLQWREDKDRESMFNAFPEEREVYQKKIAEIAKGFKIISA